MPWEKQWSLITEHLEKQLRPKWTTWGKGGGRPSTGRPEKAFFWPEKLFLGVSVLCLIPRTPPPSVEHNISDVFDGWPLMKDEYFCDYLTLIS